MKKTIGFMLLIAMMLTVFPAASFAATGVELDPAFYPIEPNGKMIIQNPTTYCNPITVTEGASRVSGGGEPVVKVINDDYYLFVSSQRGYWWSHDFVDWHYVPSTTLASGIIGVVEIDGKVYSYAGNSNTQVMATDDIKSGVWYEVGRFATKHNDGKDIGGYGDASMLYDEETGRLFMYYGWSQLLGIRVVEIDKNTWQEIGEPVVAVWGDPHTHGWETRYSSDIIFPYFDHREYRPEEYGWTEGGHPLKYNGKYYLMYASIGLEFYSYGHGVYVADDPMGPYMYLNDNPLTMKTTGIAPGAGHGSIWTDRTNNVWTICMIGNALDGGAGVTLRNLFPSGVDADGVMYGVEEYGDFPQYLPEVVEDPFGHYTKWALLTLDKKTEASSHLENYYPAFAVDENPKSFWCAETGDAGEYITVDLGEVCDIRGIQVMWDRKDAVSGWSLPTPDTYHCYTIEVSNDNENWSLLVDKSVNTQDLWSDYMEMPTPVYARYMKLTNVSTPDESKFAVKGFRAFGNPDKATFTVLDADQVKVVRSELDRRNAFLVWDEVPGAEGYLVRYGIAPDKLYNSYMVFWDSYLNIPSLNIEPEYYFEVEAFSSGTPRYVENTFETRGRGAELDLSFTPDAGPDEDPTASRASVTTRIMTYETYGVDEVYTFEDIKPGTYRLAHTFGVGIWGSIHLSEEELIGTGTEPTVEALNLTQFGNNNTKWGEIDVRVYPGETSGRIEVTFRYTIDD